MTICESCRLTISRSIRLYTKALIPKFIRLMSNAYFVELFSTGSLHKIQTATVDRHHLESVVEIAKRRENRANQSFRDCREHFSNDLLAWNTYDDCTVAIPRVQIEHRRCAISHHQPPLRYGSTYAHTYMWLWKCHDTLKCHDIDKFSPVFDMFFLSFTFVILDGRLPRGGSKFAHVGITRSHCCIGIIGFWQQNQTHH